MLMRSQHILMLSAHRIFNEWHSSALPLHGVGWLLSVPMIQVAPSILLHCCKVSKAERGDQVMAQTLLRDYLQTIEDELNSGSINDALASCQNILTHFPDLLEAQRLLGEVYL